MSKSSPTAVLKRHRTEVENPRFSATGTGFLLHVPAAEKSSGHAFSLIRSLRSLMRDLCRALVRNWRIQVYPHLQDCTAARKIMCVGELMELAEDCNNKTAVWRNITRSPQELKAEG
jgi:hypothetical protein